MLTTTPVSKETADRIIWLAQVHMGSGDMPSSANHCLDDAIAAASKGDYRHAKMRALKSLQYSVGILHYDYQKACNF